MMHLVEHGLPKASYIVAWFAYFFLISDTLDLPFEIMGIDSDNFEIMAVIHCYSCEC